MWHDAHSVAICRQVDESLSVNHGCVAIVAAAGVRLTPFDIGNQPTTFECVAARVLSGSSSIVVVVVYRPGSTAVTAAFFAELADLLDRIDDVHRPYHARR